MFAFAKSPFLAAWFSGALCVGFAGCGGAGGPTAAVKGKVVFDGQPVTGGAVTFAPVAEGEKLESGAPASGVVQADGTFIVGTHSEDDGAVLGDHVLSYTPPWVEYQAPEWDGTGAPPQAPQSPFVGLIPIQPHVEVKEGENELMIVLIRPSAQRS